MFKVNLEKELIRQNKSLVSAKELLLIREFDKLGEVTNSDSLSRVFGKTAAKRGREVKKKVEALTSETKRFDQTRVFHISQIERLCKRYHLRFLPSSLFSGSVDKDTANKISQFEVASGITISPWKRASNSWGETRFEGGSTYIAAPKGSFELTERPKDPLLFHQINAEYFYLIHKWGSDISVFRRSLSILSNGVVSTLLIILPLVFVGVYILSNFPMQDESGENARAGAIGLIPLAAVGIMCIWMLVSWGLMRLIPKNEWRSPFID